MKYDINLIGNSPSGLNVYSFKYKDADTYGDGTYHGVMSDEIPRHAVIPGPDGFDWVDYSKLDVDFRRVG